MNTIRIIAVVVGILLAVGMAVGCVCLFALDAGEAVTVMTIVLLCALVFYALLAVLALVKIAENTGSRKDE